MSTLIFDGILLLFFLALLVVGYLNRNMPQVGGKIGPVRAIDPLPALPPGFSRVYARAMTLFAGADATGFATLKDYLRDGAVGRSVLVRVYCVAGCKTEIEIPDGSADYERIDAAEALALLRELPDLRLVRRLHLSDEPSFLDPWLRKERGSEVFHLGNATNFSLVVLYKPDRRLGAYLGRTLLHEWLHLVAFGAPLQLWRFNRAGAREPLASEPHQPAPMTGRNAALHEAWCDLGEQLLSEDEEEARRTARALPRHTLILWHTVERLLRRPPKNLRSTRYDGLLARGELIREWCRKND